MKSRLRTKTILAALFAAMICGGVWFATHRELTPEERAAELVKASELHAAGEELLTSSKTNAALVKFIEAYTIRRDVLGRYDSNTWGSLKRVVIISWQWERPTATIRWANELLDVTTNNLGGINNRATYSLYDGLVALYEYAGMPAKAAKVQEARSVVGYELLRQEHQKGNLEGSILDQRAEDDLAGRIQNIISQVDKLSHQEAVKSLNDTISNDPTMKLLLEYAASGSNVAKRFSKVGDLTTERQSAAMAAEVRKDFETRFSKNVKSAEKLNLFGGPNLTPAAWFRKEWEEANSSFESGQGFASLLEEKTKRGPFQVVPTNVEEDTETMVNVVLNLKGLVLSRELQLQRALGLSEDSEIKALREAHKAIQLKLQQASVDLPDFRRGTKPPQSLLRELQDSTDLLNRLSEKENQIRSAILKRAGARRPDLITAEQVAASLPDGTVLIDFVAYAQQKDIQNSDSLRYGAAIVSRQIPYRYLNIGSVNEIDELLKTHVDYLRRDASAPPRERDFQDNWIQLSYKVWGKIEPHLPRGTKRVVISPDGNLHQVSFASLHRNSQFVCDTFEIQQRTSTRSLIPNARAASKSKTISIWSNPDFQQDTNSKAAASSKSLLGYFSWFTTKIEVPAAFGPLNGTTKEATNLMALAAKHQYEAKHYSASKATERSLFDARKEGIVVLATHGFFMPPAVAREPNLRNRLLEGVAPHIQTVDMPLYRSGLALAGANMTFASWRQQNLPPPGDDGILNAAEAANLNLNSTWLLVLSVCDTIRGRTIEGEAPLCLKLGFSQAGAQNMLFTLWRLDDDYTAEFMGRVMDKVMATEKIPESLKGVQSAELRRLASLKGPNVLWNAIRLAGPFVVDSSVSLP